MIVLDVLITIILFLTLMYGRKFIEVDDKLYMHKEESDFVKGISALLIFFGHLSSIYNGKILSAGGICMCALFILYHHTG